MNDRQLSLNRLEIKCYVINLPKNQVHKSPNRPIVVEQGKQFDCHERALHFKIRNVLCRNKCRRTNETNERHMRIGGR
jgi:hypothetical protein